MRDFLNDIWEMITRQVLSSSDITTFKQARQWFSRQGVSAAKAAKTPEQLREILLDVLAGRSFDVDDKLANDIRIYLNGVDENVDTHRPEALAAWRMLHAETEYDLYQAQKEYSKLKRNRLNP